MALEFIGYVGSIFLAICGLPQAIQSYRQKNSDGLNVSFLLLWTFGEIFTLIYVIPIMSIPLLINYVANLCFLCVIWKYKIWSLKK